MSSLSLYDARIHCSYGTKIRTIVIFGLNFGLKYGDFGVSFWRGYIDPKHYSFDPGPYNSLNCTVMFHQACLYELRRSRGGPKSMVRKIVPLSAMRGICKINHILQLEFYLINDSHWMKFIRQNCLQKNKKRWRWGWGWR